MTPQVWLEVAAVGTPEDMRRLAEGGARVDWRVGENVALLAAVRASNHGNVRWLLQSGVDPNAADAEGTTALHALARDSFGWKHGISDDALATARLLLAHGTHVDSQARGGWTPLHHAAVQNFHAMASLLLDAGAAVNAEAEDAYGSAGLRPLRIAQDQGHVALASYLRSRGAAASATYAAKRALHRGMVDVLGRLRRH